MKLNFITQKTIKEKNIILLFIVLFSMLFISTYANAQSLINKVSFTHDDIETHIIKDFIAKQIDEVIYFKFLIIENRNNVKYILESSTNGNDFVEIQAKYGTISPQKMPLLYCFKVDSQKLSNNIYRIKIESKEDTDYSNVLYINPPTNELTASKINK